MWGIPPIETVEQPRRDCCDPDFPALPSRSPATGTRLRHVEFRHRVRSHTDSHSASPSCPLLYPRPTDKDVFFLGVLPPSACAYPHATLLRTAMKLANRTAARAAKYGL